MFKPRDFFLFVLLFVLSSNFVYFFIMFYRSQKSQNSEQIFFQKISYEIEELKASALELQKNDNAKYEFLSKKIENFFRQKGNDWEKLKPKIFHSFNVLKNRSDHDLGVYKFLFEEIEIIRKKMEAFSTGKKERGRRESFQKMAMRCKRHVKNVKKNREELDLKDILNGKSLPCYEHCCFQFRDILLPLPGFYSRMSGFKRMLYDYALPISFGPFENGKDSYGSNEIIQKLSSWNNYSVAGMFVPNCLRREIEFMRQKFEDELFLTNYGRKNVSITNVFRVDRMITDFEKGIVSYKLHGNVQYFDNYYTNRNRNDNYVHSKSKKMIQCVEIEREEDEFRIIKTGNSYGTTLHVGVGIKNVDSQFLKFLNYYKDAKSFDKNVFGASVRLIIINLGSNEDESAKENVNLHKIQEILGGDDDQFIYVEHKDFLFSKVKCFQSVLELVENPNDLVLLIDVDMVIPPDFFYRVRSFTTRGKVIFNPVCFSQKRGKPLKNDDLALEEHLAWHVLHRSGNIKWDPFSEINLSNGYWRKYGVGIIAGYKCDFTKIGGYNTMKYHEKWGHEDVDIVERFLKDGYLIFHSAEMQYFHTFHEKRGWGTWKKVIKQQYQEDRAREVERDRLKNEVFEI